jgi:hypothetical protein
MTARAIILIVLLVTAGAASLWWWFVRCEWDCEEVDHEAQKLFQQGEFLSVLMLIDDVDARCHCSRFTSGDSPPQYALAQACLKQLLDKEQNEDIGLILARARGPILRQLAKQFVSAEQEGK